MSTLINCVPLSDMLSIKDNSHAVYKINIIKAPTLLFVAIFTDIIILFTLSLVVKFSANFHSLTFLIWTCNLCDHH